MSDLEDRLSPLARHRSFNFEKANDALLGYTMVRRANRA